MPRYLDFPKCHDCGQFMKLAKGAAWQLVFSGAIKEPDHEIWRCTRCVEKLGPFEAQVGIVPEFSCGLFK